MMANKIFVKLSEEEIKNLIMALLSGGRYEIKRDKRNLKLIVNKGFIGFEVSHQNKMGGKYAKTDKNNINMGVEKTKTTRNN